MATKRKRSRPEAEPHRLQEVTELEPVVAELLRRAPEVLIIRFDTPVAGRRLDHRIPVIVDARIAYDYNREFCRSSVGWWIDSRLMCRFNDPSKATVIVWR